jgi:uncharacterized membrane protein YtjA (UPF0391 family)
VTHFSPPPGESGLGAGLLRSIAAAATDIARLLFVVFLVLFVIALVAGRQITSTPL